MTNPNSPSEPASNEILLNDIPSDLRMVFINEREAAVDQASNVHIEYLPKPDAAITYSYTDRYGDNQYKYEGEELKARSVPLSDVQKQAISHLFIQPESSRIKRFFNGDLEGRPKYSERETHQKAKRIVLGLDEVEARTAAAIPDRPRQLLEQAYDKISSAKSIWPGPLLNAAVVMNHAPMVRDLLPKLNEVPSDAVELGVAAGNIRVAKELAMAFPEGTARIRALAQLALAGDREVMTELNSNHSHQARVEKAELLAKQGEMDKAWELADSIGKNIRYPGDALNAPYLYDISANGNYARSDAIRRISQAALEKGDINNAIGYAHTIHHDDYRAATFLDIADQTGDNELVTQARSDAEKLRKSMVEEIKEAFNGSETEYGEPLNRFDLMLRVAKTGDSEALFETYRLAASERLRNLRAEAYIKIAAVDTISERNTALELAFAEANKRSLDSIETILSERAVFEGAINQGYLNEVWNRLEAKDFKQEDAPGFLALLASNGHPFALSALESMNRKSYSSYSREQILKNAAESSVIDKIDDRLLRSHALAARALKLYLEIAK